MSPRELPRPEPDDPETLGGGLLGGLMPLGGDTPKPVEQENEP